MIVGGVALSQHPFFVIHQDLPREAPGSNESTSKAFRLLKELPAFPQILDIGCGPGMQTLQIAELTDGKITALDKTEAFLQELEKRKQAAGIGEKILTVSGDMFALPFARESFDLIWSEGAIYIIGFERGLREWKAFLKPNGYLVVSELTWLKDDPPEEIAQFWANHYPAMKSVRESEQVAQDEGYTLLHSFTLPEADWWTHYYTPLEARVAELRTRTPITQLMVECLDQTEQEIDMYRKYSEYYGYTFFIMQRNDSF